MNVLESALTRVSQDLAARDVAWALVAGFAVSARAEPRFTRDVDVVVAVDDDVRAESLVRSLLSDGYRLLASVEQDDTDRLATIRLGCDYDDSERGYDRRRDLVAALDTLVSSE